MIRKMTQMNIILITFFAFLFDVGLSVKEKITIYESKEFTGPGIIITYNVGDCINFGDDWQNRVSSANSHDSCVEMYTELNCAGKMKYILPGSPAHSNFEALGINDVTKSYRSCDMDEESVCISCTREAKRNMLEYNFWYYFLATLGDSLQRQYEKQVQIDGTFTKWNFVLGSQVSSNKGVQYQEMLDWVTHVIQAHAYPPNNRYCKSFMRTLLQIAEKIEKERKNEVKDLQADWESKQYVVHAYLADLWSRVVSKIAYSISLKLHNEC